jgi:hypothetical protein
MGSCRRVIRPRWAESVPAFEEACTLVLPRVYARCRAQLPDAAHRFSPKKFTQPQLAAIIALKRALRTTYRDIALALSGSAKARKMLDLRRVPHYSALYLAEKRLGPEIEKIWPRHPLPPTTP